jgi:hypothetical protein
MFRRRWLLLLVLVLSPLAGCSKDGECDRCNSDEDCKAGLICSQFRDQRGNLLEQKRCGSGRGATQCRI